MHIKDILGKNKCSFSFEFFPPKTEESAEKLYRNISELVQLQPAYVSVTYGAGGSTRELTNDLVVKIQRETDLTVVPHLTCIASDRNSIERTLERYHREGIRNIMALRGDPPRGEKIFTKPVKGFSHANELVEFIKKKFPRMGIGVAAYPEGHHETPNRLIEMDNLKRKVDAGADYICTQLFFDNNDFYDLCERCEIAGITIPIIAGIMPITSTRGMKRMAELSLGSRFPGKLMRAIERAEDEHYVARVGIHWATEQVFNLVNNGVKGIHFYTLNRSNATREIYHSLGISSSKSINN